MANLFAVPNYVKASSPIGLRRLMYAVQAKDKMQYNFYDISFVDGSWYAWYLKTPKTDTEKITAAKELAAEGVPNGISKG